MNIDKIGASINYSFQDTVPQSNSALNRGDIIGEGAGGIVYQDMDNPQKVIKEIKLDNDSDIVEATKEFELFRKYYGSESASITNDGEYCYIHMDKLPGNTIDKIETFPDSAEAFFLNMLGEMENKGIYHADLKPDNVLYCEEKNRFYPIDFSDTSEFRKNEEGRKVIDREYDYRINIILNMIGGNTSKVSGLDVAPLLGDLVGSGGYGSVFLAMDDVNFVFKRFFDYGEDVVKKAKFEASNFNRYYGDSSAEVFVCNDNNIYIKMLKVPGIPLDEIQKGELPREAELAFYEFLSGLARSRIMHDDLLGGNIHYDRESNKFYPIDIGNQYYDYFNADEPLKEGYNFVHYRRSEEILASIISKIKKGNDIESIVKPQ